MIKKQNRTKNTKSVQGRIGWESGRQMQFVFYWQDGNIIDIQHEQSGCL